VAPCLGRAARANGPSAGEQPGGADNETGATLPTMPIAYEWRGAFDNDEVLGLDAEAFETRVFDEAEWDWTELVHQHSLGWVVAREGARLVGFVNVLWDGLVHAWIQDTMVAKDARQQGIATRLVAVARD
jgi:GNAT superfamily N-acetyltransferase